MLKVTAFLLVGIAFAAASSNTRHVFDSAAPAAHKAFFNASFNNGGGVPVYVMLPLNTINNDGTLNNPDGISANLKTLAGANVYGVLIDVWFGVVETTEKQYNFKAYLQLADMQDSGFKISRQSCRFMSAVETSGMHAIFRCHRGFYKLRISGIRINKVTKTMNTYLFLRTTLAFFPSGRTPHQVYADYIGAFITTFKEYLGDTIEEIQVGLGPAGEMRYPAYPLSRWQYCGVGQFQCFDTHALASFQNFSKSNGHPEWNMPPSNAGGYSDR